MAQVIQISQELDLTPYAGRWVALVRGCVTGVGASEQAARLASKHQRPKEEPVVVFVPRMPTEGRRPQTGQISSVIRRRSSVRSGR
jgi:hypothetical protein